MDPQFATAFDCSDPPLAPDEIVRHVGNGRYFKVRSVSRTKAVCWPCNKAGKRRVGSTAIEFDQAKLEPVQ